MTTAALGKVEERDGDESEDGFGGAELGGDADPSGADYA